MKSPEHDSPTAGCDLQRIQNFLNSEHYHLEDTDLIAHLDICLECREYVEAQAGEPEHWLQAKDLLQTNDFDRASSMDYSAATCCGTDAGQTIPVKDVLDLLVPSEFPNHLGRLGTYEVTGVVGVGGMGVVLKAIDPSLDRVVAVKAMSPRLAHNENARKRFAREAKAAAAVLHPNVIPIHSVSSGSTLPYLVMSYIRGGSLQKRLDHEGAMTLVEVLRIGSQIASGLAAAHEQGLIHRDIKPENILLEEGVERVTITDFGLARSVDDNTITQLGSITGTPMYMSPEQARGEQLDQSSDLFSLGSVLYAICTGRPPYLADSSYGVMRQIIDEAPRPLREIKPDIPQWFANIVGKLMARNRADRFTSAAEVRQILEACLSHIQQPNGYALPQIPDLIPHPLHPSPKGTYRMIKFAAGMLTMVLIAIVASQFPWVPKPTPAIATNVPVEIQLDVMLDVPEISEELAERLIGRAENMSLTKVTTLSPKVAAVLAKHPGNLSFPAIEQISPEVAHALVSNKESLWIALTGLKEVSPELASSFAKAKCALDLSGVDQLTPDSAEILANGNGTLKLGLQSMTPEIAARLANHENWLSLDSLRHIDVDSAKELAKHRGWLSLDSLSLITPEVAKTFGQFNGDKLELGLTSLDLETAKQLADAKCRSGLYLDQLKTVTAEIIEVLANGNNIISFQGLKMDDASTIQALKPVVEGLRAKRKVVLMPRGN